MPLTRDFRETIKEHCLDPVYRKEMLAGILEVYLEGDFETAYSRFGDYLNFSGNLSVIADRMQTLENILIDMFSKRCNPTVETFVSAYRLSLKLENLSPGNVNFRKFEPDIDSN